MKSATTLKIQASTKAERHQMIAFAKETIMQSGGAVLDFKMFSNISVCLNFEISANKIPQLHTLLQTLDWRLSEDSNNALSQFSAQSFSPDEIVSGALQITFVHNDPDLRIAVLPVPG